MTSPTELRVVLPEVELYVREAGQGPTVVLLHGFPDSGHMWRHQLHALADAGFRVIVPDLRGFGDSSRPSEATDYTMQKLRSDVIGVLDALRIERATIVGHDFGAALAWSLAISEAARVERLVAVSVGHPAASLQAGIAQRERSWYMLWFLFPGVAERVLPQDDWAFYRAWAWNNCPVGQDEDLDRQLRDLSRPGALTAALNWYRANIDPLRFVAGAPSRRSLPSVSCPTMGVWSSGDVALGEVQMQLSGQFVHNSWRYERIEHVDHWVPVHAAAELNALLLDFLTSSAPVVSD